MVCDHIGIIYLFIFFSSAFHLYSFLPGIADKDQASEANDAKKKHLHKPSLRPLSVLYDVKLFRQQSIRFKLFFLSPSMIGILIVETILWDSATFNVNFA